MRNTRGGDAALSLKAGVLDVDRASIAHLVRHAVRGPRASVFSLMLAGTLLAAGIEGQAAADTVLTDTPADAAMLAPAFETALTPLEASRLYGDAIEFDVIRGGKKIGEHITRFNSRTNDGVHVTSTTDLKVKVLFITAYTFAYKADAVWSEGGPVEINASVKEGGGEIQAHFERNAEMCRWFSEAIDKKQAAERSPEVTTQSCEGLQGLLPTNHWFAPVVERSKVWNTLTGKENSVTITPKGAEVVMTGTGPRRAQRFDYQGDFEASAWYDGDGRWVGLAFKGRDGSDIKYVCRVCGEEAPVQAALARDTAVLARDEE